MDEINTWQYYITKKNIAIVIGICLLAVVGWLGASRWLEKQEIANKAEEVRENGFIVVLIDKMGSTYEIYRANRDNIIYVIENGEVITSRQTSVKYTEQELFKVNESEFMNIRARDILNEFDEIAAGTVRASIQNSVSYIRYLEENGYTLEFKANTSKFEERYYVKDDVYKRLIITNWSLTSYDVEGNGINMDITQYM